MRHMLDHQNAFHAADRAHHPLNLAGVAGFHGDNQVADAVIAVQFSARKILDVH